MDKDNKKKGKGRKILEESKSQSEKNEITDNERESSSLGRLARFVDDEIDLMHMLGETYSDSASDDSKDYGFDDDEVLKEQEIEQKKKKSKESI